ncbi:hypothetical protein DFS34DRAFT_626466 [Phlyctochytrium arcticum]|nr:hypothetical protein DFS34DRAFT_626466 [Phlyctochytrium arcticum]
MFGKPPRPIPSPTTDPAGAIKVRIDDLDPPRQRNRTESFTYNWCPPHCQFLFRLKNPHGVSRKWKSMEAVIGRVGFGAKGLVYGFIGGMTCASASRLHEDENLEQSPKGAFLLIGTFPAGTGLLVILLLALWCYAIWRFWEALTFQGRDRTFSKFKNFFSFRLAPFVSGGVYSAYSYYILQILIARLRSSEPSCYPNCWRDNALGRAGLVLLGVAFSIATLTQLQNALTKKWHFEIDWKKCQSKYVKWLLLVTGHIGYLGRAGIFVFVAVLMFKALARPVRQSGDAISDGLMQLLSTKLGTICMMIIGILVTFYGFFALICSYFRHFPTPPPSGKPYRRPNVIDNATEMVQRR